MAGGDALEQFDDVKLEAASSWEETSGCLRLNTISEMILSVSSFIFPQIIFFNHLQPVRLSVGNGGSIF